MAGGGMGGLGDILGGVFFGSLLAIFLFRDFHLNTILLVFLDRDFTAIFFRFDLLGPVYLLDPNSLVACRTEPALAQLSTCQRTG